MATEGFTGPPVGAGRDVALVGGRVVPVAGDVVERGTVLVRDGAVVAVGRVDDVPVPEGVPVHDTSGRWVLPGFVEAHAHLGVLEDGEDWPGRDHNETTDPNTARLRALDAVNPADVAFVDALGGGVTTVVVKPGSANVVGGRTAALKTWGRTADDMLLKEPASIKSALGENPKRVYSDQRRLPSTRMGVAAVLRDAFSRARYHRLQQEQAREKGEIGPPPDPTSETLLLALDGVVPWSQHAHRRDDIATAVRLAREHGYRLVLNHATEGHMVAAELAAAGVPCVVGPTLGSRGKVELRHRTLRTPALLAAAGVEVALTTDHPVVPIAFLVHQATFAVKEGLDRDVALRAITVNPARFLGLDDRVGSLRPGLDGDVVVWDGDPLDVMSRALTTYVQGRRVYDFDVERMVGRAADPWG
ncbi:amidohydrolase [Aquipuribacter nitratireducens]|uniref:Amidohydrolase n=1 Tax=Aquipuribacter nitratireducens TaxID=650104 RepID=A0ABW0GMQ8_9MICO